MRYLQVLLVHIQTLHHILITLKKYIVKCLMFQNFTSLLCFFFYFYIYILYIQRFVVVVLKVFIVFIVLFYSTVFLFSLQFYVLQIEFQYQENLSRNNTHSTVSLLRSFFFISSFA